MTKMTCHLTVVVVVFILFPESSPTLTDLSFSSLLQLPKTLFNTLPLSSLFPFPFEFGTCYERVPIIVENFNITRFLGLWHQIQGTPFFFSPTGTTCITFHFNYKDGIYRLISRAIKPNGENYEICGQLSNDNYLNSGKLRILFPDGRADEYWILETDYESYATLYSCFSILGIFKMEFGWILSRRLSMKPETVIVSQISFHSRGLWLGDFENSNRMSFKCHVNHSSSEDDTCF